MEKLLTISDLLEQAAENNKNGIRFILPSKREEFLSYNMLFHLSKKIASYLSYKLNLKREKIILQISKNNIFFIAYWGVVLSNNIPVLLSTTSINSKTKLLHTLEEFDDAYILTNLEYMSNVKKVVEDKHSTLRKNILVFEDIAENEYGLVDNRLNKEDIVCLFLTSGSTGRSKYVTQKHVNLIKMLKSSKEFLGLTNYDHFVNWLDIAHVVPTAFCHLFPMYLGGGQTHINTNIVIQNPVFWLKCLEKYNSTVSWAPNFAYDLVVSKKEELANRGGIDASKIHLLMNAGEQVNKKTLLSFYDLLKPYGIKEKALGIAWGMAETCSAVTWFIGNWKNTINKNNVDYVNCGKAIGDNKLKIVDDNNIELPENEIGNLQIKGTVVTSGYLKSTGLNKDEHTADNWFKTGDLAFIENGHLFITGRSKDVIIVNGESHSFYEIEKTIEAFKSIKKAISCSIVEDGKEQLAVFIILEKNLAAYAYYNLEFDITRKIFQDFGLNTKYLIKIKNNDIPRTDVGKINKNALKEVIQKKIQYDLVNNNYTPSNNIENDLVQIWKKLLNIKKCPINKTFFELGGASLAVLQLIEEIKLKFSVSFTIEEIFTSPKIVDLGDKIQKSKRYSYTIDNALQKHPKSYNELSFIQQDIWFASNIDPNPSYNLLFSYTLNGDLDREILEESINNIVKTSDILRSKYQLKNDNLEQIVETENNICVKLDYYQLPEPNQGSSSTNRNVNKIINSIVHTPFDLTKAPLLKTFLIRLSKKLYIWGMVIHHIVFDDESFSAFLALLSKEYKRKILNLEQSTSANEYQYLDFVYNQKRVLNNNIIDKRLKFWKEKLSDHQRLIIYDKKHTSNIIRGAVQNFSIPKHVTSSMLNFCKQEQLTPPQLFLFSYILLLSLYSSQNDVTIGIPVSTRDNKVYSKMLGPFLNILPLRFQMDYSWTVIEALNLLKNNIAEILSHKNIPFQILAKKLPSRRTRDKSPFFDVMFAMNIFKSENFNVPGLEMIPYKFDYKLSRYDLTFTVMEDSGIFTGKAEYNHNKYNGLTIKLMIKYYKLILAKIINAASFKIKDLCFLPQDQHKLFVSSLLIMPKSYPFNKTINQLFEEQATRTPDNTAIIFEGKKLTYRKLNEKANQLAHTIRKEYKKNSGEQLRGDTLIGLYIERSIEMMIGILGILKSGAAYVPLDKSDPKTRLRHKIDNSKCRIIITSSAETKNLCTFIDPSVILLSIDNWSPISLASKNNPECINILSDLAYVIYTSGSTGQPKGVMIEHLSLINRLLWMKDAYKITASDIFLQKTPYSFDVSVWELILPVLCGARLVIAKPNGHRDPGYLKKIIEQEKITRLHFVPTMLKAFLAYIDSCDFACCNSIKDIFCSGEPLNTHIASYCKTLIPKAKLHNLYGPTETTIDSTYHEYVRQDNQYTTVPIGKAINHYTLYVLNASRLPVPVGIPGELYIGGLGVGRGYLNKKEMTEESFIKHSFHEKGIKNVSSPRLYKTGDIVKWLPDGNLEFIGRKDCQVKIKGFRIELGEIESGLLEHPLIDQCVPTVVEKGESEQICMYYTIKKGKEISAKAIKHYLTKKLPPHMIPTYFIKLNKIPLSVNGKIDVKSLPEPSGEGYKDEYVAPRNSLEMQLCKIWEEILGIKKVGINNNFFSLGGDSIISIRVIAKIKNLDYMVSVEDLFAYPTILKLSKRIKRIHKNEHNVYKPFSLLKKPF